jgi:hypothetical protein
MGKHPIKDFKTHTQIELSPPQADHTLQAMEAIQEGLPNFKTATIHPTKFKSVYCQNTKDHNTTNQTSPKP